MPKSYEFINESDDSPVLQIRGPDDALAGIIERSGVRIVHLLGWKRSYGAPAFLEAGAGSITDIQIGTDVPDLSVVSKLVNLYRFSANSSIDRIDFSKLRSLRRCSLDYQKSLGDIGSARGLQSLRLDEVVLDDLRALAGLRSLEYLKIGGKKVRSLRGIEKLTALRGLAIKYTKIESRDGMAWVAKHFGVADPFTAHGHDLISTDLDLDFILAEAVAAKHRVRPSYRARIAPAPAKAARKPSAKGPQPGCLLLLIDQSGSMAHGMGAIPGRPVRRRADVVADAVNHFLRKLIERCVAPGRTTKGKILDWWHVGVIGYGARTGPILGGALSGRTLVPISELAANPLRTFMIREALTGKVTVHSAKVEEIPAWIDPVADGPTRARDALEAVRTVVTDWVAEHPRAFPPIIVDICDDGEAAWWHEPWLRFRLRQISTDDGPVLLFRVQLCLGAVPGHELAEPGMVSGADVASPLPATMQAAARELGVGVTDASHGLLDRADLEALIAGLDLFTAVPGYEEEWRRVRVATPFPGASRPTAWPAGNAPGAAGAGTEDEDSDEPSKHPAATGKNTEDEDDDEEPTTATRHLRFRKGSSDKFWRITLDGDSHTVRFGRTGTPGQTQEKKFESYGAARESFERLVAEKLGKGYKEFADPAGGQLSRDAFWALIERSRKGADDVDEQVEQLETSLEKLDDDVIIEFGRHFETLMVESYRYDLWGAAFIINEGASDDVFDYFRGWLIAQGRKYFEAALADPENAGKRVEPGESAACESILSVAARAYETRTGDDDFAERVGAIIQGGKLQGKAWEEEDLPRLFPRLARRFGVSDA